MNQTIVKPSLTKVNNRWVKVYTEKQKKQKSWSEITRQIDELFDKSIEDYTILHKPFNEYYWALQSVLVV